MTMDATQVKEFESIATSVEVANISIFVAWARVHN
jgi:hypothetical protein